MSDHQEFHFCIIPRRIAQERGIKRYMTGRVCPNSHVAARWVAGSGCCLCQDIYRTPKQKKEYLKKYYLRNAEKLKKASEEYRIANKDKQDVWRRNWEEKNPDLVQSSKRAYKHRRRTIEQEGPSTKELNEWAEQQEKVCFYCGCDCSGGFHLDHYYPLARGGKHEIENLRISCAPCNLSKGCKMPSVWLKEIGSGYRFSKIN